MSLEHRLHITAFCNRITEQLNTRAAQSDIFPAAEDSPLFTGTPQNAPASPYQPEAQADQPAMFDRREYIAPKHSTRPAANPPPIIGGLFD